MPRWTKTLLVVAAISMGAIASQVLSEPGQDAVPQDAEQAGSIAAGSNATESPVIDSEGAESTGEPQQQAPSRSRRRAADLPLHHAILKDEEDSAEEKILEALDKATAVEFLDLALEDCISYLQEYHGINIWLDKQSLTDEGVALDQPITLKLKGVRLESILNLILQPVQLDWVIQDEVLKITTSGWTYDHPETRTYDVQTLIDAGHVPEELIAAITKCVEPGTWTGKDSNAGISHTGGALVIRHTQRAHSEVARLIAELDDIVKEGAEEKRGAEKHGASRSGCIPPAISRPKKWPT